MRPEDKLRNDWAKYVFSRIAPFEWNRVENSCSNGMPDITYTLKATHGWLELKAKEVKRETTALVVPKFTATQRAWMASRSRFNAPVLLLFRAGKYDLLMKAEVALNLSVWSLATVEGKLCFKIESSRLKVLTETELWRIFSMLRGGYNQ